MAIDAFTNPTVILPVSIARSYYTKILTGMTRVLE
jgi:hypothetical protein